tara:strand:- start:250 stop:1005 length:756 start_codon:yes stop_codon:yes gene_type:complete
MYVDKKDFEKKPIDKIIGQTMQVISGRITKKYEFKYLTGHYVPENIGYHIHITKNRATIYMTNHQHSDDSKIIVPQKETTIALEKYMELNPEKVDTYPIENEANPTQSDYDAGFVKRKFAYEAGKRNPDVVEISPTSDFSTTKYTTFEYDHIISSKYFDTPLPIMEAQNQTELLNKDRINLIVSEVPKIRNITSPSQFWREIPAMEKTLERIFEGGIGGHKISQQGGQTPSTGGSTGGGGSTSGGSGGGGY